MTRQDDLEACARALDPYTFSMCGDERPEHECERCRIGRRDARQKVRACLRASPLLRDAMDMLSVGIALPGALEKRKELIARYASLTEDTDDACNVGYRSYRRHCICRDYCMGMDMVGTPSPASAERPVCCWCDGSGHVVDVSTNDMGFTGVAVRHCLYCAGTGRQEKEGGDDPR